MALITRVARLFRADFHAVLDRVEEPDILLRQSIREMEDNLAHDEKAYQRQRQEADQLAKKAAELERSHGALNEELDVCFNADKEDLARTLIRRRLETERSLQLVAQRREVLAGQLDQLAQRLADNRTRYESMRQKAELFDDQQREPEGIPAWQGTDIRVGDEDVEVALLKERQRRTSK